MSDATLSSRKAARKLVAQLQLAHAGELAAAYAYRGHWKSCSDPAEREQIRRIEEDEWHHRVLVRNLLTQLGARPRVLREVRFFVIGRTLGLACHALGWFIPMYAAGRLESHNVREYEDAADCAVACGHPEMLDCLLTMAEVEWDHEKFFREALVDHPWLRFVRMWKAIPPRESIRARFAGLMVTAVDG